MASLNLCQFIGNLGSDPESRSTGAGKQVVSFRLACSESWKDRDGNKQERTEWIQIVIWNEGIGKVAAQYLRKGSKCYISGKLQTRKWTDQSGADRYTTEVVVQPFAGELVLLDGNGGGQGQRPRPTNTPATGGRFSGPAFDSDLDDDIPF
jgi:single-strand DNA-binding protein